MTTQNKHRKLSRALQPASRYFDTVDMKPIDLLQYQPTHNTVSLNPFSKKSIDKAFNPYINDFPNKKFLDRKITSKDLKPSGRSRRNSNAEKVESVTLFRASRNDRRSRQHSFIQYSQGKLKQTSISRQKQGSGSLLDRYRRSSLSSPYKQPLQQKRRAISRNNDSISIKPTTHNISSILQTGKRLYKENRLDEAIGVLNGLSRSKKMAQCEYLLGLCFMNKSNYQKAITRFENLLQLEPLFKKNVYLLIGIAWKKQNQLDSAIKILTRGLVHFPDYFDSLVYRGKLYLKKNQSEKALSDFQKAAQLQPEKGFPWLGKADALKGQGKLKQGIEALNQALLTDVRLIARLRRGIFLYQYKQYQKALQDINKYLQSQPNNIEALFYKGLVLKKLNHQSQALMIWQQSIKQSTSDFFAQKSIQEMLKTKIQQKDFYQASYIISRLSQPLATLLLMKKKYQQGIQVYNSPELSTYLKSFLQKQFKNEDQKQRFVFLKPLIHTYKAFGYFSLNKLNNAMTQFNLYNKFCEQSKLKQQNFSKQYNCCLIEAINRFPKDSNKYLIKAIQLYPNKSEPYLYLAMCQVQTYLIKQQPQILSQIKLNLNKAVDFLPQLSNNHVSNIFYHRSVILLYLNEFENAVTDIDKAIQKSQDNIPKYFYLRGLIFACCSNFSQAIQDYTVCLNLDAQFAKAYIQKAKCLQMEGNITEAFNDLQKYIALKPNDPLINQYAASLLFQNCAYNDCLIALSHTKIETTQNCITRCKCYLLLGQLSKSIQSLQKCLQISQQQSNFPLTDLQILKILNKVSLSHNYLEGQTALTEIIDKKQQQGQIFHITDMLILRACLFCCQKKYQHAESDFLSCLSLKQIINHKQISEVMQIEDEQQNDDIGWSIGQVYYCMSIVALCQKKYKLSYDYFVRAQSDEIFRQIQWTKYKSMLKGLANDNDNIPDLIAQFSKAEVDLESCNTFMTRIFDPISIDLGIAKIKLPLILAYPQIQPPSLTPEFDHQLLVDFKAYVVQPKPEAPWITRKAEGVVFTSQVQIFDNLQLSVTSVNPKQQIQSNISMMSDQSINIITKDKLKQHFKLDQQIQKKLNKLLQKKK